MAKLHSDSKAFDSIFISPHLDDAILSAGNHIAYLKSRGEKILIITVFTRGQNQLLSPDAKQFVKTSGHQSATALFSSRRREDTAACAVLGADWIHWPYIDALFRVSNQKHIYKNFGTVFSGNISEQDDELQQNIATSLQSRLRTITHKKSRLYFPLAIGQHVDHCIVHQLGAALERTFDVRYWEDVPYRNQPELLVQRQRKLPDYEVMTLPTSKHGAHLKKAAVASYQSQLRGLLAAGLDDVDYTLERFFNRI